MEAAVPVDESVSVPEFDFRLVQPTLEQKCWMSNRVIDQVETASSMAKRFHFKRVHLNILVQRMRKNKNLYLKGGRPRLLDNISHETIRTSINNFDCNSTDQLEESIKHEFRCTLARKYTPVVVEDVETIEDVNLSRRSVKRYIMRLHPGVFNTSNILS